jgi:hypothetical protein
MEIFSIYFTKQMLLTRQVLFKQGTLLQTLWQVFTSIGAPL